MLMKKINAVLSLLITFLIFAHAISIAIWMFSGETIDRAPAIISWILTGLVAIHAFICIDMVLSPILNGEHHKAKTYPKLNRVMIVQRLSGALMLLFTALHIAGAIGAMTPPKIIHAIVPTLFFTIVMAHVAVSTSKAFVTLGIGSAKFVKVADVVIKVICVLTLIADVVGFYLYRL